MGNASEPQEGSADDAGRPPASRAAKAVRGSTDSNHSLEVHLNLAAGWN